MTTHNNGGPAFPCEVGPASDGHTIQTGNMQWMQSGMTLRDYFAGKALQGICAHPDTWGLLQTGIARTAYDMADEMITARG